MQHCKRLFCYIDVDYFYDILFNTVLTSQFVYNGQFLGRGLILEKYHNLIGFCSVNTKLCYTRDIFTSF